ncbi:unnamed protein product [Gongylonema pulchrum]|uniref:Serine/arginine-rich splicing factor 2 n=1 Tax=Gongylonema pulchrum TaxID=637853 RepID=A0A183DZ29_9BILA|nr:unnamed protein product [Gongylonema pulchrum]
MAGASYKQLVREGVTAGQCVHASQRERPLVRGGRECGFVAGIVPAICCAAVLIESASSVFQVDNISYQTAPQDLRRLFDKYGEIGDIHIPRDRYTKQSKGFGFVRYYNRRDAEYAMDRMDGRWVDGREIRVAMARYERPIDERERNRNRATRRLVLLLAIASCGFSHSLTLIAS